jgi:hypothetical protein
VLKPREARYVKPRRRTDNDSDALTEEGVRDAVAPSSSPGCARAQDRRREAFRRAGRGDLAALRDAIPPS